MQYTYEKEARLFLGLLAGAGVIFFFVTLWLWGAYQPGGFNPVFLVYSLEMIGALIPP